MDYLQAQSPFRANQFIVGPSHREEEIMSPDETEISISMEEASFLLEKLYYDHDDMLQKDFLERMEPTLRTALGAVEDEKTEHIFQSLAVMNLAGHLNRFRPLHDKYVEALSILGDVFLTNKGMTLPSDDLEATMNLPKHLAQRLHPSAVHVQRSKFQKNDNRIYLLMVAVVAHVVAQGCNDWLDLVLTTKSIIQSSFYVDPDTVRVGLAVYGLQVCKKCEGFKGLTIQNVLADLTQKWSIGIFASCLGLSQYVASMYVANSVLSDDFTEDEVYRDNLNALHIFLRETGASFEDAAYSFIKSIRGNLPSHLCNHSNARDEVLVPEYSLLTHLMVFLARDDISAARKVAMRMELCSLLSSQGKMDAWARILNHLRHTGILLLDGNHSTPGYERKYQDLTVLVMSMGYPLGIDVLCNFYSDFISEVAQNSLATDEEISYISFAAQRTLLILLRAKFSNDKKAFWEWFEIFPDVGFFGGDEVEWAEQFLQRKFPIPPSILKEGIADLKCFLHRRCQAIKKDEKANLAELNGSILLNEHMALSGEESTILSEAKTKMFCIPDQQHVQLEKEEIDYEYEEHSENEFTNDHQAENDCGIVGKVIRDQGGHEDSDSVEVVILEESNSEYEEEDNADSMDVEEYIDYDSKDTTASSEQTHELETKMTHENTDDEESKVVELLDDSDEYDVDMEKSDPGVENQSSESEYLANEADIEQFDDESEERNGGDTMDENSFIDAIPILHEAITDQLKIPAVNDLASNLWNQTRHPLETEACSEKGYEPDTAGREISQAEMQARLEQGYEPDGGSQVDEQEDLYMEEIRAKSMYQDIERDEQYDVDEDGNNLSQKNLHDRLADGYEPDVGYNTDGQIKRNKHGSKSERELKEAEARLEKGYEPDTAGGDISQAEMQDRFEKGYEPDTTAVYTEEEVSEAIATEEEDNMEEQPECKTSTDGIGLHIQKPMIQQSCTLSDDMDAADDFTEAEQGAELSEIEESMSHSRSDIVETPVSSHEACSTLIAFAHEAQNRINDKNHELATDLSCHVIEKVRYSSHNLNANETFDQAKPHDESTASESLPAESKVDVLEISKVDDSLSSPDPTIPTCSQEILVKVDPFKDEGEKKYSDTHFASKNEPYHFPADEQVVSQESISGNVLERAVDMDVEDPECQDVDTLTDVICLPQRVEADQTCLERSSSICEEADGENHSVNDQLSERERPSPENKLGDAIDSATDHVEDRDISSKSNEDSTELVYQDIQKEETVLVNEGKCVEEGINCALTQKSIDHQDIHVNTSSTLLSDDPHTIAEINTENRFCDIENPNLDSVDSGRKCAEASRSEARLGGNEREDIDGSVYSCSNLLKEDQNRKGEIFENSSVDRKMNVEAEEGNIDENQDVFIIPTTSVDSIEDSNILTEGELEKDVISDVRTKLSQIQQAINNINATLLPSCLTTDKPESTGKEQKEKDNSEGCNLSFQNLNDSLSTQQQNDIDQKSHSDGSPRVERGLMNEESTANEAINEKIHAQETGKDSSIQLRGSIDSVSTDIADCSINMAVSPVLSSIASSPANLRKKRKVARQNALNKIEEAEVLHFSNELDELSVVAWEENSHDIESSKAEYDNCSIESGDSMIKVQQSEIKRPTSKIRKKRKNSDASLSTRRSSRMRISRNTSNAVEEIDKPSGLESLSSRENQAFDRKNQGDVEQSKQEKMEDRRDDGEVGTFPKLLTLKDNDDLVLQPNTQTIETELKSNKDEISSCSEVEVNESNPSLMTQKIAEQGREGIDATKEMERAKSNKKQVSAASIAESTVKMTRKKRMRTVLPSIEEMEKESTTTGVEEKNDVVSTSKSNTSKEATAASLIQFDISRQNNNLKLSKSEKSKKLSKSTDDSTTDLIDKSLASREEDILSSEATDSSSILKKNEKPKSLKRSRRLNDESSVQSEVSIAKKVKVEGTKRGRKSVQMSKEEKGPPKAIFESSLTDDSLSDRRTVKALQLSKSQNDQIEKKAPITQKRTRVNKEPPVEECERKTRQKASNLHVLKQAIDSPRTTESESESKSIVSKKRSKNDDNSVDVVSASTRRSTRLRKPTNNA